MFEMTRCQFPRYERDLVERARNQDTDTVAERKSEAGSNQDYQCELGCAQKEREDKRDEEDNKKENTQAPPRGSGLQKEHDC